MNSRGFKVLLLSVVIMNQLCKPALAAKTFSALPTEIVLQISEFLNSEDQRRLSSTDERFRNILVDEYRGKKAEFTRRSLSEIQFRALFAPSTPNTPAAFYSNAREIDLSRSMFRIQSLEDLPADLEYLNLSHSVIVGEGIPSFERFTQLKTLILYNTRMTKSFGLEPTRASNASAFSTIWNIPGATLAHLPPSLVVLELAKNKSATTAQLALVNRTRLPNLKYLGLANFSEMGAVEHRRITPNFIAGLPNTLEHLNLSDTDDAAESLRMLTSERFPHLKFLNLSKLSSTPFNPLNIIQTLPISLEWLDLTDSTFAGNEPNGDNMAHALNGNAFNNELEFIGRFQNLKGLSLNHTQGINHEVIEAIRTLVHLETLDLHEMGYDISADEITSLRSLPALTRFALSSFGSNTSWLGLHGPGPAHWASIVKEREALARRQRAQVMGMFLN